MKKLFFILVSVFIFNSAAIGQIPLEKCSNGSYQPPGQCPYYQESYTYTSSLLRYRDHWIMFAFDEKHGTYGQSVSWDKTMAKKEAIKACGTKECKIILSVKAPGYKFALAALSTNNQIEIYKPPFFSTQKSTIESRKSTTGQNQDVKNLLNKCESKYKTQCKIVFNSDEIILDLRRRHPGY